MLTIHSELHREHHGRHELIDGTLQPPVEKPERADRIVAAVRERGLGPVREPDVAATAWLGEVHGADYVEFLRSAWGDWRAAHGDTDALPLNWPVGHLRRVCPTSIDGRLGYYSFDAGTPITAGTWTAATASASVALSGAAAIVGGEDHAFSLCRPPGHHAAADTFGGYCFLNNAALAVAFLQARGRRRIAILDVDYHHGNGTQAIFEERADVLFVSLHADPRQEFPYFLGYAGEAGRGEGEGFTLNLPLPWGTGWDDGYADALERACSRVAEHDPDCLVVSLGVDTFDGDPISRFRLQQSDFPRVGRMIRSLGLATLFVMEGGYAVEALGDNVASVLTAFEAGAATS